jgi:hypothetical protein
MKNEGEKMSDAEEFLSFEVLDDPEMIEIGQRLIEQGSELLDVTDMDASEKKQAEKIFSESWNRLYRVKTVKKAFLRVAHGKTQSAAADAPKKVSRLGDLLKNFLSESMDALDYLSRLAKLCTHGNMAIRSFLKDCPHAGNPYGQDIPETRAQALNHVLQEAESGWLKEFRSLHRQIHEEKNICLMFQTQNNAETLKFLDGRSVEKIISDLWNGLSGFCEDYMAHLLQFRFLNYVAGLEVIPREDQDLVYPRKFKILIQGASSGNDGKPE